MTSPGILYLCINLPDCSHRRQAIEQQALTAGIQITFINAVDGRHKCPDTTGHKLGKPCLDWKGFQISGPQLGCILSHRNALRTFLSSDHPFGLILEDDAHFPPDLEQKLTELTRMNSWDAIKVENRLKSNRGHTLHQTTWGSQLIIGTKSDIGSTAILYTRAGAQKVLNSLSTITLPFDVHLSRYPCWSLGLLDCYPPIITQTHFESCIGDKQTLKTKVPSYRKKTLHRHLGQCLWSIFRFFKAASHYLQHFLPSSNRKNSP